MNVPRRNHAPEDWNQGEVFAPSYPFTVSGESQYRRFKDGRVVLQELSHGWLYGFYIWPSMVSFQDDSRLDWKLWHQDPEAPGKRFSQGAR